MALINCPNCGKEVSDRAESCPQCGYDFKTMVDNEEKVIERKCEECGESLPEGCTVCPNCGCPIDADEELDNSNDLDNTAEINLQDPPKKRKGKILIAVGVIIMLCIGVITVKQIQKESYHTNLQNVTATISDGALKAENSCNLIINVWGNSIYEKSDKETDPYTKNDYGTFYSDFNDALGELFDDQDFSKQIEEIITNQNEVASIMGELRNPPKEYEEAYDELKDLYESYLDITGIAIDPRGSYNSITERFNKVDSEIVNDLSKMKVYI